MQSVHATNKYTYVHVYVILLPVNILKMAILTHTKY